MISGSEHSGHSLLRPNCQRDCIDFLFWTWTHNQKLCLITSVLSFHRYEQWCKPGFCRWNVSVVCPVIILNLAL